jgi:glucose/arabinose dehydrogenase
VQCNRNGTERVASQPPDERARLLTTWGRLAAGMFSAFLASLPAISSSQEPSPQSVPRTYTLELITKGLSSPVAIAHEPSSNNTAADRVYIVQKRGEIRILSQGKIRSPSLLDIEDIVGEGSGLGLHSLAFSPSFERDKSFYVTFSDRQGDTIVAKFQAKDDDTAEAEEMQVVFKVVKPSIGHAESYLSFGPDGHLYVAIPDGGEPEERSHAQSPKSLLGKVLRISVANGSPYQVPSDNPFKNSRSTLPEIWASGFHNPTHFVINKSSGAMFLVDVGAKVADEINEVTKGGDYGWDTMEGTKCLKPPCPPSYVAPRLALPHTSTGSFIGGVVYGGDQHPELKGRYIYIDTSSKTVRALSTSPDTQREGTEEPQVLLSLPETFSALGEDSTGEILLTSQKGAVFRLR